MESVNELLQNLEGLKSSSKKPKIAYFCSYVPEEIIHSFGFIPYRIYSEQKLVEKADGYLHNNLCPYVRFLFDEVYERSNDIEGYVFIKSCDAMARLYDAIKYLKSDSFVYLIDLPKNSTQYSREYYLRKLEDFIKDFEDHFEVKFSKERLLDSIKLINRRKKLLKELVNLRSKGANINGEDINRIFLYAYTTPPEEFNPLLEDFIKSLRKRMFGGVKSTLIDSVADFSKKPRILLTGSVNDKPILAKIVEEAGGILIAEDTCKGIRPSEEIVSTQGDPVWSLVEYAFNRPPCPRMKNSKGRIDYLANLIKEYKIDGIIFHNMKFCDFYYFDYIALRDYLPKDFPMIQIEGDYTEGGFGQVKTRIESLIEMLANKRTIVKKNKDVYYTVGIDSGSTTTKVVVLNSLGEMLSNVVIPTGASVRKSAEEAFNKAIEEASLTKDDIDYAIATGYGRGIIPFVNEQVTEITCHAKGMFFSNPEIRTIIDIGGQDSKAIKINDNGDVVDFVMNDKCAAGTGRFLEVIARVLGIDITELGPLSLKSTSFIQISSMCTVFAESEVISLLAEGHLVEDIIYGLHHSVVKRTLSLVERIKGGPPFGMSGGVAKNIGLVKQLEQELQNKLYIPRNPQIIGALGASYIALERLGVNITNERLLSRKGA